MSYRNVVPRVLIAHAVLIGMFLLLPVLQQCSWFKKPPLEVMEIDLASLPPPPDRPEERDPAEPEDEAVIPRETPVPTPRPTAVPTATPTPAPDATPQPTATPRPTPTPKPTPTPTWRARTPEEIRQAIEQQNPDRPPPVATLSSQQLSDLLGEGLNTGGGSSGVGSPGGTVSFSGVAADLYNRLYSAWVQPRHLSAMSGTRAVAEVVVGRNGRVRSTRLTSRSGIPEFDRSVETALSSVSVVKPLPEAYDGDTRSFKIEFELSR